MARQIRSDGLVGCLFFIDLAGSETFFGETGFDGPASETGFSASVCLTFVGEGCVRDGFDLCRSTSLLHNRLLSISSHFSRFGIRPVMKLNIFYPAFKVPTLTLMVDWLGLSTIR